MNSSKVAENIRKRRPLPYANLQKSLATAFMGLALTLSSGSSSQVSAEPLQGQISTNEQMSAEMPPLELNKLIGVWKVQIPQIRRKPTVTITSVNNSQITGTYKGLLGSFPLWGKYQVESGTVQLFVDFSNAKVTFFKRRGDRAIAQMSGKVDVANQRIAGSASLPEFSNRVFAFNGSKSN